MNQSYVGRVTQHYNNQQALKSEQHQIGSLVTTVFTTKYLAQSAGAKKYATASLQRGKTLPMSVLDKTLNNLRVRLQ